MAYYLPSAHYLFIGLPSRANRWWFDVVSAPLPPPPHFIPVCDWVTDKITYWKPHIHAYIRIHQTQKGQNSELSNFPSIPNYSFAQSSIHRPSIESPSPRPHAGFYLIFINVARECRGKKETEKLLSFPFSEKPTTRGCSKQPGLASREGKKFNFLEIYESSSGNRKNHAGKINFPTRLKISAAEFRI